jgi:hypothetical protein
MAAKQQMVQLTTASGCSLAIGPFPRFSYDARGGGGSGLLLPLDAEGRRPLHFSAGELRIPPLTGRTGRCLGLPLPPGLQIRILPERLQGWLDPASGSVQLHFQARFLFSAGRFYQAPPLWVDTMLTSATPACPVPVRWGEVEGQAREPDGALTLVGVAPVAPSGDRWFDSFLGLPSEALALLRCQLTWGA